MSVTKVITQVLIAGVDTHQQTHHVALIDAQQQHLGDREFPATAAGYRGLLDSATGHGPLQAMG